MADDPYQYPPDLLALLIETIPSLCRSKEDVVSFLRGAGAPEPILGPVRAHLARDKSSINKYQMVRTVLSELNELGDRGLAARREVVRRVCEFEDFSRCWPTDQLKARGLVAEVRRVVDVKDSFTRMRLEQERERHARVTSERASIQRAAARREQLDGLRRRLVELFQERDPHRRGTLLERLLNELFALDGLLIREAFVLRTGEGEAQEQIDGVVELDGHIYLVEVKWWSKPIGVEPVSRHLVRLFTRSDARGLMISASGFSEPAIRECTAVLSQRVMILAELRELVLLLERGQNLSLWLREKSRSAVVERQCLTSPNLDRP